MLDCGFLTLAPNDKPALLDPELGQRLSYAQLIARAQKYQADFSTQQKALVAISITHKPESIAAYLGALAAKQAVLLLPPEYSPAQAMALCQLYQARFWWHENGAEWALQHFAQHQTHINNELALLLSTSGSTGSAKMVRLSWQNVQHNIGAICNALALNGQSHSVLHLPLAYAFGLSILHTHLAVGSTLLLWRLGWLHADFWPQLSAAHCQWLAGVPHHYDMLARLGLARLNNPQLRHFIQAGGKLSASTLAQLQPQLTQQQAQFFIMYGQTEAAPRMSILPLHQYPDKSATVGQALAGGQFSIEAEQIIYHGANVMLGYAHAAADLSLGDVQQGRLATGDSGALDAQGFLTIHGRIGRQVKIFGVRVNLDEVEQHFQPLPVAALLHHEQLHIFCAEKLSPANFGLPATAVFFHERALPRLSSGKIDYQQLAASL